jgi:hypothetical protein
LILILSCRNFHHIIDLQFILFHPFTKISQMEIFCVTIMVVEFLLLSSNSSQAQTTQTGFNQMELMNQFIGNWECEIVKNTTFIHLVVSPFGTTIECNYVVITNGDTVRQEKWIWGYDKNNDKIIEAVISKTNTDITLNAMSFKSKNTLEKVSYKNISDFTQSAWIVKYEFITPDLITMTYINSKSAPITWLYTRVK